MIGFMLQQHGLTFQRFATPGNSAHILGMSTEVVKFRLLSSDAHKATPTGYTGKGAMLVHVVHMGVQRFHIRLLFAAVDTFQRN